MKHKRNDIKAQKPKEYTMQFTEKNGLLSFPLCALQRIRCKKIYLPALMPNVEAHTLKGLICFMS